jgi:hypothetical protein
MRATAVLPILSIFALVTVEYGGWALLSVLTGRSLSDFGVQFFRAGHAHAGVLLVLSLVYFVYLDRTPYGNTLQWLCGLLFLLGVMAQSGGFFVHMAAGGPGRTSLGTKLTRAGGLVLGAALVLLGVGLIRAV